MYESVLPLSLDYYPDEKENVVSSMFHQYEVVIVHSIITSFGLNFLVKDHLGGDVDTIHNVREGIYQRDEHKQAYDNRGEYNSYAYHKDVRYKNKNKQISKQRKNGELYDAYTGDRIPPNGKTDLDHVISAYEIHNDPGRVLANLNGVDLANNDKNLQPTNLHINRTKNTMSMDDFLERYSSKFQFSEEKKRNMRKKDAFARKAYEVDLYKAYYTSPAFAKDVSFAAGKVGVGMGLRQLFGFVFTEIWFLIKEEFNRLNVKPGLDMDMGDFFRSIGDGIKRGFESSKVKYMELFSQFANGTTAGILSSLTTTLCNIFFTTAKNVVRIIRQSFASLIEATKILLINPQNYSFGERMRAVVKVLATGASVVLGTIVSEAIGKTPIAAIPGIGNIVQTFCGTLCTGVMSCTFLLFIDRSTIMNFIVSKLNLIHTIEDDINYYKQQALLFERYAAELMQIDLRSFQEETSRYNQIAMSITASTSAEELNLIIKNSLHSLGISMSWEQSHCNFDSFMNDKTARMVFE